MNAFSLPTKWDWAWTLGLILAGCLLGFGLNAATGKGIDIPTALGSLKEQAASAPAAP